MNEFQQKVSEMYRATPVDDRDCPPSEQLARWLEGRLWPWQRRALLEHVSTCSDCADAVQLVLHAEDGLCETLGVRRAGATPAWRPVLGFGAAASTALLAAWLLLPMSPVPAPDMHSNAGDALFASNFDDVTAGRTPGPAPRKTGQDILFQSDFDRRSSG